MTFEPGRCYFCCGCETKSCLHSRQPCEMCAEKLGVDVDEDTGIAAALERTLGELAEAARLAAEEDRDDDDA